MNGIMEKGIGHRLFKFAVVGASGVLVNMCALAILKGILRMPLEFAGALAIEISIMSNFMLNDLWTWRDSRWRSFWGRMWRYHLSVGITAFGINYPVLLIITKFAGIQYLWANLIGIALASLANFVINHFWTYGKGKLLH